MKESSNIRQRIEKPGWYMLVYCNNTIRGPFYSKYDQETASQPKKIKHCLYDENKEKLTKKYWRIKKYIL